jgi:thiol-disulfide isomerase/thioredoxin
MNRLVITIMSSAMLLASAFAADAPSLKAFARGSWAPLLRAHAGHPTLIHFWGVTCGPCKEELPQLGAFMRDHPDIDMVMISADLVPDLPAATKTMLQKSGLLAAENWIFDEGFVERLRFEIDPAWQDDIPRTMLVARDGKITTIEGVADLTAIENWRQAQHDETTPR